MNQKARQKLEIDARNSITRTSIRDVAVELQSILTQRLVAYAAGLADGRDIGRYARGEREPQKDTVFNLKNLLFIVSILKSQESSETIQSWFMGMNPLLDDHSPAELLRADPNNYSRVLDAARDFVDTAEQEEKIELAHVSKLNSPVSNEA